MPWHIVNTQVMFDKERKGREGKGSGRGGRRELEREEKGWGGKERGGEMRGREGGGKGRKEGMGMKERRGEGRGGKGRQGETRGEKREKKKGQDVPNPSSPILSFPHFHPLPTSDSSVAYSSGHFLTLGYSR